jgi:hypothetical protein
MRMKSASVRNARAPDGAAQLRPDQRRSAPVAGAAHPLHLLQLTLGNAAVQRLLRRSAGAAEGARDRYEQEAEVQASVERSRRDSRVGRGAKTANGGASDWHAFEWAHRRPLSALRADLDDRFGAGFAAVRVHTGSRAAAAADALGARAFTAGEDIVLGRGVLQTGHGADQGLLAHEFTHVAQQRQGDAPAVQMQEKKRGTADKQETKTDEAADVVVGGLKTVAEQAKDNNPKVKKEVIEPIKERAKGEWEKLSGAEKGVTIGFGAATLGLAGGALLSDPSGRRALEGANLATPLQLIPYMPLTDFSYTLPKEGEDKPALTVKTKLSGDEWLAALRKRYPGLPPMSLQVTLDWSYDFSSDHLSVSGGQAKLSVFKGITVSGGTFKRPPSPRDVTISPEGANIERRKALPEPEPGPPMPGWQVMVSVDLLRLDTSSLPQVIGRPLKVLQGRF